MPDGGPAYLPVKQERILRCRILRLRHRIKKLPYPSKKGPIVQLRRYHPDCRSDCGRLFCLNAAHVPLIHGKLQGGFHTICPGTLTCRPLSWEHPVCTDPLQRCFFSLPSETPVTAVLRIDISYDRSGDLSRIQIRKAKFQKKRCSMCRGSRKSDRSFPADGYKSCFPIRGIPFGRSFCFEGTVSIDEPPRVCTKKVRSPELCGNSISMKLTLCKLCFCNFTV